MPTGSVAGVVALTIHSSLDERRVATGTYCSLGRAGDIRLVTDRGAVDGTLHAEALYIANLGDRWSAQVPEDGVYEVVVAADAEVSVVGVGEERIFRHTTAEVRIETEVGTSRARIHAPAALPGPTRARGGTQPASLTLDPDDPCARVWIVACRDRLAGHGAGALAHHEVAAILAGSDRWEDKGLNDAGARKRASRVRGGAIEGWLEACGDGGADRDGVVDLLVRRGIVTPATYGAALR
jgi:hypothetical protein